MYNPKGTHVYDRWRDLYSN